jgi:hypothetical protein
MKPEEVKCSPLTESIVAQLTVFKDARTPVAISCYRKQLDLEIGPATYGSGG